MALIKCSDCGKEVSDRADNCPHCGLSVKDIIEVKLVDYELTNKRWKAHEARGCFAIFLAIFLIVLAFQLNNEVKNIAPIILVIIGIFFFLYAIISFAVAKFGHWWERG